MEPLDMDVIVPGTVRDPESLEALLHEELNVIPLVRTQRGGPQLAEVAVLVVALKPFLDALLESLGTKAADAVGRVVRRLGRPTRLRDRRTGVSVELGREALDSDRALRALTKLDLKDLPSDTVLHWDEDRRAWLPR